MSRALNRPEKSQGPTVFEFLKFMTGALVFAAILVWLRTGALYLMSRL